MPSLQSLLTSQALGRPRLAAPHERRCAMQSLAWFAVALAAPCAAWSAPFPETPMPTPASVRMAASRAQALGEPLVLMVSLPGCPWCELLRRNYLVPMRSEGVQAFQIMVNDRSRPVVDFQGVASHGAAIASSYRAKLAPTLLFLNAQGAELAPRIEGVASADFIGALIDERLALARAAVRAMPAPPKL